MIVAAAAAIIVVAAAAGSGTVRSSLDCATAAIDLHWRLRRRMCEWRLQVAGIVVVVVAAAVAGRGRGRTLGGLCARTWHTQHGTVFSQLCDVVDAILIDPFHLFMLYRRLNDATSVYPAVGRQQQRLLRWQSLGSRCATAHANRATFTAPST